MQVMASDSPKIIKENINPGMPKSKGKETNKPKNEKGN